MNTRIIDVRQYPEYAGGYIAGSELIPLDRLAKHAAAWDRATPITLVCRSGRRAEQARQQLDALGFTALDVLPGGVEAWAASGKSLQTIARRPWSLERQVRTAAGSLILLTMLLAFTVSHWFLIGTALIGAGLTFAGITDICMMATILGRMPWNRGTAVCS